MINGAALEYRNTFNLASAAGQLVSTIDKMSPARALRSGGLFYRPAVSPRRGLRAVTVTFDTAATQTVTVSIVTNLGNARIIASSDVVAATAFYFEPEHEIVISPNENFQVDVTATGAPAVTGTINIFTEEV